MAIGLKVRKFVFQNASSGKLYEVRLMEQSSGAINGVGKLLGTNSFGSTPKHGFTEVSFVVLTAQAAKVFGPSAQRDTALAQGAYFDASNPAAAGAALSTLLT